MQSKIIENIFSDAQINELKKLRDTLSTTSVSKRWPGREVKPLPDINLLSNEVKEILQNIVLSNYIKPLKLYAVAFGRYSKEFGIPKLGPHIDEVPSQFTLDYQLDGNIEWPLNIEGEEYLLKNNNALIFEGESVLHWRPKRNFVDGEFLDLMWFQFIEDDHWAYKTDLRPDYNNFKKILFEKIKKWKGVYDAT